MTVGLAAERARDANSHSLSAPARLLAWVALLYLAGLYFFTSGFLLTRLRLENASSCAAVPGPGYANRSEAEPAAGGGGAAECWYPARFKKVVVLLIDALRFDFAAYDDGGAPASAERYRNRLKTLHRKLREEPYNSLLFQSIADPPTTTLQRLMGITTGTLPTFVDAGSNFAGQALGEDNIIDQLAALGRRMAFLGDDTWLALYPDAFRIKHPYPSFDVWDLHSVDDGVLKHLFPLLDRPGDWDVLVAHFLGVDHCGHRYGPDHPAMQEKLDQMDEAIARVLWRVDEDALVVVLGDHGMDGKGDHGGDSPQEVETALFLYSKTPIVSREEVRVAAGDGRLSGTTSVRRILQRADEQAGWKSYTQLGGHRTVAQIDLLPTLSLLLGAPIPFNNLGSVIPELFTAQARRATAFPGIGSGLPALLVALRLNARQTHRYMSEYQASQPRTELAAAYRDQLLPLFSEAEELAAKAISARSPPGTTEDRSDGEALAEDAAVAYMVYLRKTLKVSQQAWARFSPGRMGLGLAVTVVASIVAACLVRETGAEPPNRPEDLLEGVGLGLALGAMSGLLVSATGLCAALGFGAVDAAAAGATVASVLAFLRNLLRSKVTPPESRSPPAAFAGCVVSTAAAAVNRPLCAFKSFLRGVIPLLPAFLIPASNSLVIHEDKITSFLLQTFGVSQLLRSFTAHTRRTARRMRLYALVFLVITRLSAAVTICREEQMPSCVPTFYATAASAVPSGLSVACLGVLAALAPLPLKRVLRDSQNFHGAAAMWIDVGLRVVLGLCAAYRLLDVFWEAEHREVKVAIARVAAGA
ncbi:MAG: alkaline-phosphatase-like protein, partial [Olpidium bornovanus]